jgi:hypothetical protein
MATKKKKRSQTKSRRGRTQKKSTKRRRTKQIAPSQTNEPFEQDAKHGIGQYGGAGEPPLMKK